jgi:pyruvate dehydrogenase E1 component alpha subunit
MTALADADVESMLLIRYFELRLLELFADGLLHGTTHTCLGQEYVPVAVSGLLGGDDHVFSNHRGHGHYLARFADPEGLLAEIMGREGGVCRGVGGSQHLYRPGYLSTGVQGESLPLAAGVAMKLKRTGHGGLSCVYIGDGTWGEGAVYEALNLIALLELPVLVVVEHNGIAQSTPTARQMAGTIAGRAAAFGIAHRRIDSADVDAIRAELAPPVERVRDAHRPLVVEFATHRLGPHSKGDDTRPAGEIARLQAADWLPRYRRNHPEQTARLEVAVRARIDAVVSAVSARPPSTWERPA